MWYISSKSFRISKKVVTAQSSIQQLDNDYFGVYNQGRLFAIIPVNQTYMNPDGTFTKIPQDPSRISNVQIDSTGRYTNYIYLNDQGQPEMRGMAFDKGRLESYLNAELKGKVLNKDTRSDFERIKNEERLQGQLYREMVQLANQLFAKYQNREQVKKDLQYRIFDLFQSGQISEKLGNYLYKWMTDYVNDEEKLKANVKTSFSLETYLNKLLSDPRFNGTSAQKIPGGYTINFVMPNVPSEGQMFKSTFNVSNGADLINKVNEFIAQSKYTPEQKQEIQTQNNNALPQSNEQIVPEPYKWPRDIPEIDLTKRK